MMARIFEGGMPAWSAVRSIAARRGSVLLSSWVGCGVGERDAGAHCVLTAVVGGGGHGQKCRVGAAAVRQSLRHGVIA
jgi:hypothetical protein